MKDFKYICLLILGFIIWGLAIFGGIVFVSPRTTEIVVNQIPQISEEEKYFDKLTEDIIQCESQGNPNAVGDLNYPHHAFGLIQVQIRTWNWLGEKMGFKGDINNPEHQRKFLRLALEKGFGGYWTCFSTVKRQNNNLKMLKK